MGASNLTKGAPGAGDGEVVDGAPAPAGDGHVAKRRKRQKAMAVVAANGHVSKVARRKAGPAASAGGDGASNGAVVAEAPVVADADEPDLLDAPEIPTVEAPAVDQPDMLDEPPVVDDPDLLDETEVPGIEAPFVEEPAPRGRAARRAQAAHRATPAARRAELVATAAEIVAAAAEADASAATTAPRRGAKTARRLFALVAIVMVPASVYALTVTDGPASTLTRADATYLSGELISADQRVRTQLVRLRPMQTAAAIARTRDATLTARSLAVELDNAGGAYAKRLRRALTLEAAWLDAVGSILSNPRSTLRGELVSRDTELRAALGALPGRAGRRSGGAAQLVRYAQSRVAAQR